jgi:hypothetical protein
MLGLQKSQSPAERGGALAEKREKQMRLGDGSTAMHHLFLGVEKDECRTWKALSLETNVSGQEGL